MSSFGAMGRFTARQQLEYNEKASKRFNKNYWKVVNGFVFYIRKGSVAFYVEVPTGYLTDGASIPRYLWWLIPPLGEYSQGTTVHDYLCNTYMITEVINGVPTAVAITRKEIDYILFDALEELGVVEWKRNLFKIGVNVHRFIKRPKGPVNPVRIAA